jgi:hypothetical protein
MGTRRPALAWWGAAAIPTPTPKPGKFGARVSDPSGGNRPAWGVFEVHRGDLLVAQ